MQTYYQDKYCKVTEVCIIIYKYYFPLATSRTIMFSEMEKITLESCLNVRHKWGLSTHFANNWFHYDGKRRCKEHFIAIHIKGKRIIPSLTPVDATKVFEILRKLFTPKVGAVQGGKQEAPILNQEIEEQENKEMIEAKYNQEEQDFGEQKPSEIELNPMPKTEQVSKK